MNKSVFSKIADIFLTVVICFAVIIALLWFVHTFNVFELPDFIESFFSTEKSSVEKKDEFEENLLKLLESESYTEGEYKYVTLTSDKALQLLASISVSSDYFWEVETTVEYDDDARVQLHKIYKQGNKVRFDTSDESTDFTTIISDVGSITVNNLTGEQVKFSGDTEFTYSRLINIAAMEHFLDSDNLNVNSIAVVEFENEKYLYVEIPKNGVSGIDKYFVSLDYGVVMYASSEIDGNQYFLQKTIRFDCDSIISDTAFEITDSEK